MNSTAQHTVIALTALLLSPWAALHAADAAKPAAKLPARPNIILLLSDDLGQRDVGCFGQQVLRTPRLDQMAKEGTRFPQLYCGTSICAPSRTSLMTGLHCGHTPVRGNREIQPEGQMPLPAGTITVAQILKRAGYATACTGKWGMGMFDTTGSPLKLGFDHFYGYNCQRHAHNYFPKYLYSDDRRIELNGEIYAQNLIADETLAWVRQQKDRPFFLYYAVTLPHGNYQIDSLGQFAGKPWPANEKAYAAMVSRLDSDVGRLLDLLKELGIDERTIVIFSGDNGNTFNTMENKAGRRFPSTGDKLRGGKGTMYEGGLRQAGIVRWPGHVPAGRVSQAPWAFWDFLPTAADLAGAKLPEACKTDGRSVVPLLLGGEIPSRPYFYWELHEGTPIQAVRFDHWKAVRNRPGGPIELYDLRTDISEATDIAAANPDLVAQADSLMRSAHVDDPNWPMQIKRAAKAKKKPIRGTN